MSVVALENDASSQRKPGLPASATQGGSQPAAAPDPIGDGEKKVRSIKLPSSKAVFEASWPPLAGILAFLGLWALLAPRVETSLGVLPGPGEVWGAFKGLMVEYAAARAEADQSPAGRQDDISTVSWWMAPSQTTFWPTSFSSSGSLNGLRASNGASRTTSSSSGPCSRCPPRELPPSRRDRPSP